MIKATRIEHAFVEYIPESIEEGVLYVSMPFATAVHRCCCGCRREVVTPLSPTDWKLIFDGESVSLAPSIGNWSFPCQSHYWITHDQIRWAGRWTTRQIEAGRERERREKEAYFAPPGQTAQDPSGTGAATPIRCPHAIANRVRGWLKRLRTFGRV